MKKRTAIIGALVSLMPLGHPLVIGTGAVLTSTAVMLSVPAKVNAENLKYYLDKLEEIYNKEGEEYRTIFFANEILKINQNNVDAYWYRAYAKVEIGKYYEGIADYTKSIELGDNASMTFNNRGVAKNKLEDHYGAIFDYNLAIVRDGTNFLAYANRGSAKQSLGDMKGACADWREASYLGHQDAAKWVSNQC